jgi:hypothetical protein
MHLCSEPCKPFEHRNAGREPSLVSSPFRTAFTRPISFRNLGSIATTNTEGETAEPTKAEEWTISAAFQLPSEIAIFRAVRSGGGSYR